MKSKRIGKLLVVSAPSGTGKSTVCETLRSRHRDVAVSISYTTRSPRGQEQDGVAYHFVTDSTFAQMISDGSFLEWAEVHRKRYGSARADTEKLLEQGFDVLFDIDVQGGFQIKHARPDAILVFLVPPSIQVLMERLAKRATEKKEEQERRLRAAIKELEQGALYEYHVINDVLEDAIADLNQIRNGKYNKPKQNLKLLQALVVQTAQLFP